MAQVISSDENVCKSISKLKREENLYVRKGETVVGCNQMTNIFVNIAQAVMQWNQKNLNLK